MDATLTSRVGGGEKAGEVYHEMDHAHIVLFDGVCNMCNGFVNFIIDNDPNQHISFASLQSKAGRELLDKYHLPLDMDTMVLIEDGKAYTKSTAVLRTLAHTGGLYYLLFYFGSCFPVPFRDLCYSYVAANRYAFLGQSNTCRMPTPAIQARFLAGSDDILA